MAISHFNTISIGVGGQGVISATQILAEAALLSGYKVRTAETHGMAQRGGSVSAYLRFGMNVFGPLIPKRSANLVIGYEPSEVLRIIPYISANTTVIYDSEAIFPLSLYQNKKFRYPSNDEIKKELLKITDLVFPINASKEARKLGNIKIMNVIMIGAISGKKIFPIDKEQMIKAIHLFIPEKLRKINDEAFELGLKLGSDISDKDAFMEMI